MPDPTVLLDVRDAVATITLNRPQALNSYTLEMADALGDAIARCKDDAVRAVVVTGAGRAFCAGADLREVTRTVAERGEKAATEAVNQLATRIHAMVILPLRRLRKPTIAMVNGAAAGAGAGLALACDLRIASEEARFVLAFSGVGLAMDSGTSYFLPRLIGSGRSAELHFLNEPIDAARALALGLVNAVAPSSELAAKASELAKRLAVGPTAAFARTKDLLETTWTATLQQQLSAETQAITDTAGTADFFEGVGAFSERRIATFRGR
ncbi:MAG: enoyl-CoA hydratase [SAR202 cluster bacterium]|nr:enoyl-CoA hydratase [SAR202 cluster bacterium]